MPDNFLDARIPSRQPIGAGPQVNAFFAGLSWKENAVIPSGAKAFEVDLCRIEHRLYEEIDPFTGAITSETREIVSGGGALYHTVSEEHVPSRTDLRRAGAGITLPRDVEAFFHSVGEIPGSLIVLCEDRGMILDAFGLAENRALWERCRRAAIGLKDGNSFFLKPPAAAKVFHFRGGERSASWWAWAHSMRVLLDGDQNSWNENESRIFGKACGFTGARNCRPVQNLDRLPSLEQCFAARKVPLRWGPGAGQLLKHLYEVDCKLRSEQLEGGATRFGDSGTLRPELLPTAGVDWESPVRRPPV
jgi:hypothetical protein